MKKLETTGNHVEKSGSSKGVIPWKIFCGDPEYWCGLFEENLYPIYKLEKLRMFICITEAFHIALFYYLFLLEYNCFTMLCWFLLYNNMNQLHIYISPPSWASLPLLCLTPLGHHSTKLSSLWYSNILKCQANTEHFFLKIWNLYIKFLTNTLKKNKVMYSCTKLQVDLLLIFLL